MIKQPQYLWNAKSLKGFGSNSGGCIMNTPFKRLTFSAFLSFAIAVLPGNALAEDVLSKGDTAWVMTSTALVLFMTLPGLAVFYGGLVTSKNVLSVLMHCFGIATLISVLWLLASPIIRTTLPTGFL